MPIYEYVCKACGQAHEALQKFSDEPLMDCPACHQSTLQKIVSASGFQLKGSGWYVTDYRGKDKSAQSADGATSSDATNSSDTAASS